MKTITIDPITRIEGHLKIEVDIEEGVVKSAKSSGTLFRGLEEMLSGREPRDAQRITQRVCGVCPTAHATASSLALDDALGIKNQIPTNGGIIRNLMLGANFLQSHILHFYHLSALDYLNPVALKDYPTDDQELLSLASYLQSGDGAPFAPQYSGDYRLGLEESADLARDYLLALEIRKKAHELLAIFGGKMPHNMGIVPGGVTNRPDLDMISKFEARLKQIRQFIQNRYIPGAIEVVRSYNDYFDIGRGVNKFLEYGGFYLDQVSTTPQAARLAFLGGVYDRGNEKVKEVNLDRISEKVTHSWYADQADGPPTTTRTLPHVDREGAYSWVKAPRYQGLPCEVGPAARMLINYRADNPKVKEELDKAMAEGDVKLDQLASTAGRHLARAVEAKVISDLMADWVMELEPGKPTCAKYELPKKGSGVGVTCAPRGTLGHWIKVEDTKIARYQLVVPTTWNASPKDGDGNRGPIEKALIGTEVRDPDNPIEVARIVRSFDPCMACAVH